MTTQNDHHELSNKEKIEALRRVPFFSELPDDLLLQTVSRLKREHYAKGDVVFVQGGVGNALYIIESGQVSVTIQGDNNEERLLSHLGPGNFFGETALLTGQRRTATVKVTIDADFLVLHKADLDNLLIQHPAIALTFSRELSRRLSFTDHRPVVVKSYKIITLTGQRIGELAESLTRQTGGQVVIIRLDNATFPVTDSLRANPNVTLIDAPNNLTAGGLAQLLSSKVDTYDWIFVHILPRASQLTLKALELADVNVHVGEVPTMWQQILASRPHWIVPDNHNEIDPLARRIARKRIGIALSSGNGRGIAHIGVLKVLEEAKIPIDMMAGTSVGSLFGGFYAAGMSIAELTDFAMSMQKWAKLSSGLWDFQFPPHSGLLKGDKTLQVFRRYVGDRRIEDLKIPMHIVAADILSGEEVIFSEGPLAEAIRASISVVMIFSPVRIGSRYLIDGGAVNPVPTTVLADRGADIIIASSVIPSLEDRLQRKELKREGRVPNMIGVIMSMMEVMESEIIKTRMNPANIVIRPAVEIYETTEFHHAPEFIKLGEEAAYRSLDQIKQLLAPQQKDRMR